MSHDSSKAIFGTLNGLRGIAALIIVAFHGSLGEALSLGNGYLAVDLFFVLSGLVIAHAYEKRLKSGISLGDFVRIRLIRLYPLYIFGILISILFLLLSYVSKGQIIEERLKLFRSIPFAILMLPSPPSNSDWSQGLYPLNPAAWSLFFELVINLVYAATFRYWTSVRLGFGLIVVASILFYNALTTGLIYGGGGANWSSLHFGLLRVCYSFPAGVLIYRIHQRGARIPIVPPLILITAFPFLLMLPSPWCAPFNVLVGFPLLVALASASEARRGIAAVSNTLGAASYAMYAIHSPLYLISVPTFSRLGLTPLLAEIVVVACIIPFSLIIDRVYDTPIRGRLNHWYTRTRLKMVGLRQ